MKNLINFNVNIAPQGFENYRQFINYKIVNGEKIPSDKNGKSINAHDTSKHLSLTDASTSSFPLAFVFTKNDPFFFIDLDDVYKDNVISHEASLIAAKFPGAAMEISYSKTGLHIFGTYDADIKHKTRGPGFPGEIYTHNRFVALTGYGRQGNANGVYTRELKQLITDYNLLPVTDISENSVITGYTGPEDDETLLRMMEASRGSIKSIFGAGVWDLYTGNTEALTRAYPASGRPDGYTYDRSEADAALMAHLAFWTGKNKERMLRLFKSSKLYRDKHTSYHLNRIIELAYTTCRKVYDKPQDKLAAFTDVYLTIEQQHEHFKSCVYIRDKHKILIPDGTLLKQEQFNAIYGGHEFQMTPDGSKPTRKAFEAFTESRVYKFPKATDICFLPGKPFLHMTPGGRVNTYIPADVKTTPGDVSRFLNHIKLMFPDERDYNIITNWMCALVQNPGVKFQWTPVIQGAEGNGKSLIMRSLTYAVGNKYSHLPKAAQISEKYNDYLDSKLFIGIEEIYIPDRREILETLKDALTNDRIEIRPMHGSKYMADNFTNWLFLTNHKDGVPKSINDRRYAVFYTAQQSIADIKRDGMDGSYFPELYKWFNSGGVENIAHWLRNNPVADEFSPVCTLHRAPETSSTLEAIHISLGRVEQLVLEAIEDQKQGFRGGWISSLAFLRLLEHNNIRHLTNYKRTEILRGLGYQKCFRSSQVVPLEGGRPYIWRQGRSDGELAEYLYCQGY